MAGRRGKAMRQEKTWPGIFLSFLNIAPQDLPSLSLPYERATAIPFCSITRSAFSGLIDQMMMDTGISVLVCQYLMPLENKCLLNVELLTRICGLIVA
ncbi:MAG: hypothetical protein C4520_02510 [Candidatus Abyssobacteria bacterium SURF_5]|uniref:Uncharacterized protein n=1 Tax=Abyssobacteria bacterium (strain SURF_5) TaxID=2093360 RepID=A0A3A4PC05_ABYX5|nr:MAG: hypothetical protein C4520_02510 [Candidatus Abyssubacteria bacterium SURF_5]